ncbi:MAG TPA: nitrophenyl compound nitroreductase subunit ArsF family protein, partial [Geopsychrobacteraceae bacterium]
KKVSRLPRFVFLFLLLFLHPADSFAETEEEQIRVYFFHGTIRCYSCLRMSSLLGEALQQDFSNLLDSGVLQWRPVNIELAESAHYLREFGVSEHDVVLVKYRKGKPVRWVKLNDLWKNVERRKVLFSHVKERVETFRRERD